MSELTTIDQIVVPERLDGRAGRNRGAGRQQISAADDRSAVLAWLARYVDSPATLASYRKESERFLLWCVLQHQVALSDLTHEDLLVYQRFLSNPEPAHRWIMAPGQKPARSSPAWRPFAGPLSPSSVRQALSIINNLFSWLVEAGYLIEQTLSVDNMFVFVMIFTYFAVPPELQRRVLLYGVLGAIVMRAAMILGGVWLVSEFAWVLYVFGLFLVVTGIKMLVMAEQKPDLEKNPLLRWLRGHMRITPGFHGDAFFVRINGLRYATPMFMVLMMIEVSDLVFAVDSIPAIFAVTTDPFIVFTSNIFAIMGLRALYFLLADMAERFHLLKYGLALVLVYIGGKMLVMPWFHIPVQWSLPIVGSIILISVILSLKLSDRKPFRGVL